MHCFSQLALSILQGIQGRSSSPLRNPHSRNHYKLVILRACLGALGRLSGPS